MPKPYLPENGRADWWNAGLWPPPIHQPFREVRALNVLRPAAEQYALSGLTPSTERGMLLSQMDALVGLVNGAAYQAALKNLRERP